MKQREIKFRAWDKENKRFVEDFVIDRLGNEYQQDKCEFWGDERYIVLMQYTGLKDKNGKEIYEGDIVKSVFHGTYILIEWEVHRGCCCDDMVGFRFHDGNMSNRDVEVIGNVYENPELLKQYEQQYEQ